MRVRYLKCGTDCPLGGPFFDGFSKSLFGLIPCAAQLVETNEGLVLIDTGYGSEDVRHPHPRLSRFFRTLLNIHFRAEETALHQIKAMGYSPSDVRHVVLTHLDFDHAGGLDDFPNARVHVMEAEREAAERKRRGFIAERRYRPAQWEQVRDWRTYAGSGECWFGLERVRQLDGLPPEILMVPLPGHTWGHAGIAIRSDDGWVLNAGDAYFYRRELDGDRRRCTPGLRLYQNLMEVDRELRFANQQRLRELKRERSGEVTIFCSHDEIELEAMQRRNGDTSTTRAMPPIGQGVATGLSGA
ncbi:MBL fold metallo-hydrolase [Sphingobium indicum]|uniref:MBL fold metallo-hydrolase n=2 Tax=Sphingobium indicum TaxID=332055 RepID=I5BEI6_SPHIB|nr:MBL fold metallo-hydrolase [Sphingobium indicum]APL95690.1 MBL fold metallo-hydrolase [Sphingobium indicum B90A]KEZ00436.1 beta-lactamase [Sphingomonas sp. BHC-A]RYM00125.1 MBL fold metallo-hydrolase [Sphingobium indicum]